jgi:nucleoside-diphosphate-sugar epimerase
MNIVVTGGDGFIGKHLVSRLANLGHRIYVIDNHITSFKNNIDYVNVIHFENNIEDFDISQLPSIDVIFHLASVASPLVYKNDFDNVFKPNVIGTQNMIELSKRDHAKLFFSSTSEVYGTLSDELTLGTGIHEDSPAIAHLLTERSIYPNSKRIGEELVYNHARKGYFSIVLRLFNVFGYNMDLKNSGYGRVIPNFINRVKSGKAVQIFGDGYQIRSFIWIDDLIDVLLLMMEDTRKLPFVFNIGNDEPHSIIELAQIIFDLCDQNTGIEYQLKDKDDPDWRRPNCNQLKTYFNWRPSVSLREGLKMLIQGVKHE